MKLLWSKPVPMDNPWEPYYAGVFCKTGDKVHFLYKDGRSIAVLAEDSEGVENVSAGEYPIPLPRQWILTENGNQEKLLLNEELLLDISGFEIITSRDPEEYRSLRQPEKYYEEASFSYDGYTISHSGYFGYQCEKDGQSLWVFRGQGYLYTDICFREDRVFFGTAGQGGYFYVLDMNTGNSLAKIKTGGTASFVTVGDRCYVLSNGKTAKLLCVDLTDGSICGEAELPGKASVYSRLRLIDGRIHAITFSRKKDILHNAIWNCIDI